MEQIFYIIALIIILVLVLIIKTRLPIKDESKNARDNFWTYLPEKKSVKAELRKVSDITTKLLREERNSCLYLKRVMKSPEYIAIYQKKLEPINVRLSIKQTKP